MTRSATSPRRPGRIITFYSYKGGTGRSMTLANVAWVLASNGKRVLAVDWDLEAPGLHRYFAPFLVDRELTASEGVIDFVIDYASEAMTPSQPGEVVPPDWYVEHADLPRYAASLEWDGWEFPDGGTLDFVSAGRQGPSYSTRVNTFDWQSFYDRHGGGVFLEAARERMRAEYNYVLIDSRTGVSDTSGICTVQMPDVLVVCFTLNNQGIEGAAAIASSVASQRGDGGIRIFPVPTRIEMAEKEKLESRREYARRRLCLFPEHLDDAQREEYWGGVEMPYVPYYAYEEVLAAFGERTSSPVSLLGAIERLTAHLTDQEVQRLLPPPEAVRQSVLAAYARRATDEVTEDEASRAAETVYASVSADDQRAMRRLCLQLVRVEAGEPDTRARVPLKDLASYRHLLNRLLGAHVLTLETDPATQEQLVQIADEGLVARWQRLRSWLDADREFLTWRQGFQAGLAEWERSGRNRGALLRGLPLQTAHRWRGHEDLTERERTYLQHSERARTWRRLSAAAALLLLVLAAGFGIVALESARKQQRYADALRTAEESMKKADLDGALRSFDQAIKLYPERQEPYLGRAAVYRSRADFARALEDAKKALALDPSSQQALLVKADILAYRGDYQQARTVLDNAIRRHPENPQAYRMRGDVLRFLDENDEAVRSYTQAIRLGEKSEQHDERPYFLRGLARLTLGDKQGAVSDLRHVAEHAGDRNFRAAAEVQLRDLGVEMTTPPQREPATVLLHYRDPTDAPIVESVVKALAGKGFETVEPELIPRAATWGDVRYFFAEDQAQAAEIRAVVEDDLARAGFPLSLAIIVRDGKSFPDARPGRVEVWLPSLSQSLGSTYREPAPAQ